MTQLTQYNTVLDARNALRDMRSLALAAKNRGAHKALEPGMTFFPSFPTDALAALLGDKVAEKKVADALEITRRMPTWKHIEPRGIAQAIFASSTLLAVVQSLLESAAAAVEAEKSARQAARTQALRDERVRWIRNNLSTVNSLRKELHRTLESVPDLTTLTLVQLDELNRRLLSLEASLRKEVDAARLQDERRGIRRAVQHRPFAR
jgi:hypothetical protein